MDWLLWLGIIIFVIWLAGPIDYHQPEDWHNGNWRDE